MEQVTWLVVFADHLGVAPEDILVAALATAAGVLGGALGGPVGAGLARLSVLLFSRRPPRP